MDLMVKMSEGNPGALMFCMELFKMGSRGVVALINLDDVGLYGEKLYMLWSDCCGRDAEKAAKVSFAFNLGKLSKDEIHERVAGAYGKPFTDEELEKLDVDDDPFVDEESNE
jgi:hypothetical protein